MDTKNTLDKINEKYQTLGENPETYLKVYYKQNLLIIGTIFKLILCLPYKKHAQTSKMKLYL